MSNPRIGHSINFGSSIQNTNTPEFNLERDLIVEEIALGIETGERAEEQTEERGGAMVSFRVNLATIAISALLFLIILAWFDFIQTAFYTILDPALLESIVPSSIKLWYALLITGLGTILIILIMYHSSIKF